jgi:hypothetical protein
MDCHFSQCRLTLPVGQKRYAAVMSRYGTVFRHINRNFHSPIRSLPCVFSGDGKQLEDTAQPVLESAGISDVALCLNSLFVLLSSASKTGPWRTLAVQCCEAAMLPMI